MKWFKLTGLVVGVGMVVGVMVGRQGWGGRTDLRLGLVSDKGLELVSVMPQRRMINVLRIEGEMLLWVPGGLGWYRAEALKRLLVQENKTGILGGVFFYNFGFIPQKIVAVDGSKQWDDWENLRKTMGIWGAVSYKWRKGEWYVGETWWKKEVDTGEEELGEVVFRDFASEDLIDRDLKVWVVNESGVDGIGKFVAKRLDWAGFSVMGASGEEVGTVPSGCRLVFGKVAKESREYLEIVGKLLECEVAEFSDMSDDQVRLSVGEKFSEMIKYQSYVRSF